VHPVLTRKALWIPAAASGVLLVVLALTGWGGSSDTASTPTSTPSVRKTTTQVVSLVPTVAAIVVKTTTTTPPPPPTTTVKPPPQVTVPTVPTSASETPDRGLIVVEGAPCRPEGAIAVSSKGKPLVCRKNSSGRLRWNEA
jgi:hypothetical protein